MGGGIIQRLIQEVQLVPFIVYVPLKQFALFTNTMPTAKLIVLQCLVALFRIL